MDGHDFFCEVDTDFILDKFNLTGLNTEVDRMGDIIDVITDNFNYDSPTIQGSGLGGAFHERDRQALNRAANHLYGMIHARFIMTARGLQRMLEKYQNKHFGTCPRVLCEGQPLLPIGLHDNPQQSWVRLYCPKCEDLYVPRGTRHATLDGAYFGTSFPGMLFQMYPKILPERKIEKYSPKIYGFKVHEYAKLERWQNSKREKSEKKVETVIKEVMKIRGSQTKS